MTNFQKKTVFFCTGVLSVQFLTSLLSIQALIIAVCFSLLVFKRCRGLSYFFIGFVWASSYALFFERHQLSESLEGLDIQVTGEVIDLPVQDARSTRFFLRVTSVDDQAALERFPSILRLSWYGSDHALKSGDQWRLLVKLKRPHGLANPHGFDYEKWLFHKNIGATGYVRESKDNALLNNASSWSIASWREYLRGYLTETLAGRPHVGVIKALVLGDKSDISVKQWDVFRQTGTSHLIAISGLHVGLISALVFALVKYGLLRCFFLRDRAGQYALLLSLLAAFIYAALAGFSVPTQRALLMLFVVMGAVFWRRHYTPFHVICAALLGVLIIDPLAPLSAGFWLSFCAVAVILYGVVGKVESERAVKQLLGVQWKVAIGLMPLVLLFFGQVSLVAPLANLLAVPLMSFLIVPLLLVALLSLLVSESLSSIILKVADTSIDYLWQFLELLAGLSFSSMSLSNISLLACVMAAIGAVLLLSPKGIVPKPLACALFIPLIFPMKVGGLGYGEFRLVLLDVGQGLSAVVHTSTKTLVFDTGAKYSETSDLASTVVMPYLKGEGVQQIDVLLISHGDNDHAGGADTLINSLGVKRVLTSVPGRFPTHRPVACKSGMKWVWDGVNFEILSPSKFNLFEGNNASCVLKVSSINGSTLLPGDIEKSTERSLLQYKKSQLNSDVLIAPHHGSKTSSTIGFIKAVAPQHVLFPVGYKNRFGFPKKEIVKRYDEQKIARYDTATQGALTVNFGDKKPLTVSSHRYLHAKFWNWKN